MTLLKSGFLRDSAYSRPDVAEVRALLTSPAKRASKIKSSIEAAEAPLFSDIDSGSDTADTAASSQDDGDKEEGFCSPLPGSALNTLLSAEAGAGESSGGFAESPSVVVPAAVSTAYEASSAPAARSSAAPFRSLEKETLEALRAEAAAAQAAVITANQQLRRVQLRLEIAEASAVVVAARAASEEADGQANKSKNEYLLSREVFEAAARKAKLSQDSADITAERAQQARAALDAAVAAESLLRGQMERLE